MTTTAPLLTADDLLALGSDRHCELVEGVLTPMSPTSPAHGEVTSLIAQFAGSHVRANRLGRTYGAETGFRLRRNPDSVRAPDFAFVARGRIPPDADPNRYLDLAPDLAVEVVSPSDTAGGILTKVREYLAAGVRLVWVAYPEARSLEVYHPDGSARLLGPDDRLSGDDVLPGFDCPVSDLFPTDED